MQSLPSRTLSTETLVRGAGIIRSQTMSLEKDVEFAALKEQQQILLATRYISVPSVVVIL